MSSWCLDQDRSTLLDLLAFCATRSVNLVQAKHDRPEDKRFAHGGQLSQALQLDMTAWFRPTQANYFSRVSRDAILSALSEARGKPPLRAWQKLKKSELAVLADRETDGTGWLPQPLKA